MKKLLLSCIVLFFTVFGIMGQMYLKPVPKPERTFDELLWEEKIYRLHNTDSPLSSLKGFDKIYPCRYSAKWAIIGDTLYLYNVVSRSPIDSLNNKQLPLENIERFLKAKFTDIPISKISEKTRIHLKNGVIPATWYIGNLYPRDNFGIGFRDGRSVGAFEFYD